MADSYDPYREALVLEENTCWPGEYSDLDANEKARIAAALHADPENCASLEYIRIHTGFCRSVSVTAEDVERVR